VILTCGTCGHSGEDGKEYNHDCYWVFREHGEMAKKQREARRAEKEAEGQDVRPASDVRPVLNSPDLLVDAIARVVGPEGRDDDIPVETRRELMQCATNNGRINYWYLCDLWRRGKRVGDEAAAESRAIWDDHSSALHLLREAVRHATPCQCGFCWHCRVRTWLFADPGKRGK
jgi:hypothetical protein